jgi:predicted secreted protein with PEFG-CTERM motif
MPINLVQSNFTESEYQLVATSIAPGAAFYGSGVLAVVTFNVTSSGSSPLTLKSELADYNPQGSEDIVHTNQSGSVTVTVIPEFPGTTILVLFLALATAAMLLTAKQLNKKRVATGLKRLKTIS